jgi:hypothetical protein
MYVYPGKILEESWRDATESIPTQIMYKLGEKK